MPFPPPFYRWRPHPWHGLDTCPNSPAVVNAYIEITPFDLMKYEVDKITGYLRVDRPQRTSSQPPSLYGFIPRTYCGRRVGELTTGAKYGDGDPLDICVFSERPIAKSEVILTARVVGGLQLHRGFPINELRRHGSSAAVALLCHKRDGRAIEQQIAQGLYQGRGVYCNQLFPIGGQLQWFSH